MPGYNGSDFNNNINIVDDTNVWSLEVFLYESFTRL